MPLSAFSRHLQMRSPGRVMNNSASRQSIYSCKSGYFSARSSTREEKNMSWLHLLLFRKYVFPFSQLVSKLVKHSTRSGLFLSWGSTTSIFGSYYLNSYRIAINELRIPSANVFTARDRQELIRRVMPSAAIRMSAFRSSRPFPSIFATELIFPICSTSLRL